MIFERASVIENYDELPDRFGVSELFDWPDVEPDSLANVLAK